MSALDYIQDDAFLDPRYYMMPDLTRWDPNAFSNKVHSRRSRPSRPSPPPTPSRSQSKSKPQTLSNHIVIVQSVTCLNNGFGFYNFELNIHGAYRITQNRSFSLRESQVLDLRPCGGPHHPEVCDLEVHEDDLIKAIMVKKFDLRYVNIIKHATRRII